MDISVTGLSSVLFVESTSCCIELEFLLRMCQPLYFTLFLSHLLSFEQQL